MRLILNKRSPAQLEFGILYGGIAFLVLLSAWFVPWFAFLPSCAFKGFTGIPCPTCGATRSIMHLAHGGVLAAIAVNPLIAFSFLAAILYLLYSLVTIAADAPQVHVTLTNGEKNAVRIGAIGIVLINWTYLICNL